MPPVRHPRIIRKTPAEFFETNPVVIAVHDQVANVVHIHEAVWDDPRLFRRALFMEEPVMLLPDGYLA